MRDQMKKSLLVVPVFCAALFIGGQGVLAKLTLQTPVSEEVAVFAGGCFWGVEAVFEHVKGVKDAVSGYAGGTADTAHYKMVGTGKTGHAEAVKVTYDPSQISYQKLLDIFFTVAHDPTELNRQGPDSGTQYRSEIFYTADEQRDAAKDYIAQANDAKKFPDPVVTLVEPLDEFYPAEAHHQDYAARHPDSLYIFINDRPKVENLKKEFPALYREQED